MIHRHSHLHRLPTHFVGLLHFPQPNTPTIYLLLTSNNFTSQKEVMIPSLSHYHPNPFKFSSYTSYISIFHLFICKLIHSQTYLSHKLHTRILSITQSHRPRLPSSPHQCSYCKLYSSIFINYDLKP
jgi:hypothetical protein